MVWPADRAGVHGEPRELILFHRALRFENISLTGPPVIARGNINYLPFQDEKVYCDLLDICNEKKWSQY